jgi:hypothetical protein
MAHSAQVRHTHSISRLERDQTCAQETGTTILASWLRKVPPEGRHATKWMAQLLQVVWAIAPRTRQGAPPPKDQE